jgi:hypothetical protein
MDHLKKSRTITLITDEKRAPSDGKALNDL